MGKKIFVSYKYADADVPQLEGKIHTTVRNYVDKLETYFDSSNNIYKGESDGEDLSHLSEDRIWEKLKARIFDSSITIVIISPNMRETDKPDKDQWIPWEISYSLKEMKRRNRTSCSNAVFAVVLPDRGNDYTYFMQDNLCNSDKYCKTLKTEILFSILRKNMFNNKKKDFKSCLNGRVAYDEEASYIFPVKWKDFILDVNASIERACKIKERIDEYEIYKEVE